MDLNLKDVLMLRRWPHEIYPDLLGIKTTAQLQEFQEHHLKGLLLHAYARVPYYYKVFGKIGLVRARRVDMSKFDRIPVLTKDILQRFRGELISRDHQKRGWFWNMSGGSTGQPVRVIQDDAFSRWSANVVFYYYKHMLGIEEPIAKRVILWGSESDFSKDGLGIQTRFRNWLANVMFLNSYRMSKRDFELYIKKINAYRPELIRGYSNALFELCDYAARNKRSLYSPKAVVTAAERLTEGMRQVIGSAFNAPVFNFYGSRETSALAGECKKGRMHQFAFFNYMEVLDRQDQPVGANEVGRVVVTNLANYAMPLIRYDLGDTVARAGDACPCGNALPTLQKVIGRVGDHFVTRDGTLIDANYFDFPFEWSNSIRKYQLIQENYERIRVKVVLRNDLSASDKDNIENRIRFVMGDSEILWDVVDDIPECTSGKYSYVRSLVRR